MARADDRRVLNGIYWRLRTGSPWADIPERYGPPTTCYNRFVRWRKTADGHGTCEIMRRTAKSKTAVWRWQERFMQAGIDGLLRDKTRP